MASKSKKIQHFYFRAGFGIHPAGLKKLESKSLKSIVEEAFNLSADKNVPMNLAVNPQELAENRQMLSDEQKKELKKASRDNLKAMNKEWFRRMCESDAWLREKVTLFWHGHFACSSNADYFTQQYYNVLREHALGKFPDLLMAVSKSPAMLQFLNNQQNRKDAPNENFAREVMELFTLGRGHYTEKDIKEAARAFTGWGFDKSVQFVFRKQAHDFGEKEFMGQKGNFGGEEILEILLKQRRTATYIASKFYAFFVSELPHEQRIEEIADYFFNSGYDIAKTLKKLFLTEWFYDDSVIGTKIKSPIELLAGTCRAFSLSGYETESLLFLQKALGQILFFPPNVAGWPGGQTWIDNATLLIRLNLPFILFSKDQLDMSTKEEADDFSFAKGKRNAQGFGLECNWDKMLEPFSALSGLQLTEALGDFFFQAKIDPAKWAEEWKEKLTIQLGKEACIRCMQTPEYQLV